MKTVKKVLSLLLALTVVASCFLVSAVPASAATSNQNAIVTVAKNSSKYGIQAVSGQTQKWVSDVYYKALGGTRKSAESCKDAWNKWGVSTSTTNIPVGAVVYGNTGTYGHCAIYVGGNKVVHNAGGSVKTVSFSSWQSTYKYVGWHWNGSDVVLPTPKLTASSKNCGTYTSTTISLSCSGNKSYVDGYQIYCITNGTTKTLNGANSTSANYLIDNQGKVFKFKVRSYGVVDGKTVYGTWSNVLTVGVPTKPTSITSLQTGKKKFTVAYNKVSGSVSYQIQYSTSSDFSNAKTVTVTGTSKTVTGLKNNTKYYVRVRTIITLTDGTVTYKPTSTWSTTKTVTTKQWYQL